MHIVVTRRLPHAFISASSLIDEEINCCWRFLNDSLIFGACCVCGHFAKLASNVFGQMNC